MVQRRATRRTQVFAIVKSSIVKSSIVKSSIVKSSIVKNSGVKSAFLLAAVLTLGGCNSDGGPRDMRAFQPIPADTLALMNQKGANAHSPMLIRAYKKEAEMEIWKMGADGRYVHVKTFPMCRWSGQLGPKRREGDRQVPEGFYTITPGQMNPNSAYYLSFNVGYPNAYDRAHGYDGGSIMVHGACSSAGCFSMTDKQIAEIYAITRESFGGGQRSIQMQSFPFRMTAENFAKYRLDPNIAFWKELKKGSDYFEVAKSEPTVSLCGSHYNFGSSGCGGPSGPLAAAIAEKERMDEARIAELSRDVTPVRMMYADGGQNKEFSTSSISHEVSRPEAIAAAVEVEVKDVKATKSKVVAVSAAKEEAKAARAKAAARKSPEAKPAEAKSADAGSDANAEAPAKPSLFSRMWGSKSDDAAAPSPLIDPTPVASTPAPKDKSTNDAQKNTGKPQASLSGANKAAENAPPAVDPAWTASAGGSIY